jgi:hypothetical protein
MLITDQVAHQLPKGHGHRLRKLSEASLKGCSAPVGIIEVYDQDPLEVQHLKNRIEPLIGEGLELFKSGCYEAALSKFQMAQDIYPQDLPLQLLVTSVRSALEGRGAAKGTALLDFR